MNNQLEKTERMILLMDYYGNLLTDKQKECMQLYYEEDLSLSEIAEELAVSRNAIFDQLKRTAMILEEYESKLRLLDKHLIKVEMIDKMIENLDDETIIDDLLKLKDI